MKQTYHSNATTNSHLRSEIQSSSLPYEELSANIGVSVNTIYKWKSRNHVDDKSSRPKNIKYSLSPLDSWIATSIRRLTWLPLDEIVELIYKEASQKFRSAVYRIFVREGINRVPVEEKEKAKKFKQYDPGYLHVDVTYLPKIDGVKYYLFVAIDRATRLVYFKVYTSKSSDNAENFIKECLDFFPFQITHVLTDNGLEFTNKCLKSKKGIACTKPSKVDELCLENSIDHRLTKPFHPKTNGMVEKANDIIKNHTVKRNQYENARQMNEDLIRFLINYNLYRRHGSLRRELNVRTPFDAACKWHELSPEIFNQDLQQFNNKILNLKTKIQAKL